MLFRSDISDYDRIDQGDTLVIKTIKKQVNDGEFTVINETNGFEIKAFVTLSDRQKEVLISGGQLNYLKKLL